MTTYSERPPSQTSSKSRGSRCSVPKYKVKSPTSFVDATLFSSKTAKTEVAGRDIIAGAVTITRDALEAMLAPSPILSIEERQRLMKQQQEQLRDARAHAQERKERMLKMEAERRKHQPLTESEILKEAADKATTQRAKHLMEEQLDDVKQMNQMMLYAQCVAIRDKQVEEKKQALDKEKEENRRLDDIMEADRQRAVQAAKEAEKQKVESRFAGARVIEKQLDERKRERIKEAEVRRLESEQMLMNIEKVKKEDELAAVKRKEAADQMMEAVAKANREQVQRKEQVKQQEKEDELRVLKYIRQRDAREQEELEMKERIAKEKELETARLRALQEKMADKQAELDELRARRYQEAKEKEWRDKELEEKRRKEAAMEALAKARESQKAAKIRQLGEMARMEQQDFYRVLEVSKAKAAAEAKQEQSVNEAKLKYKDELLLQVEANEVRRVKENDQLWEESAKSEQERQRQKQKLEAAKARKIHELKHSGVPDKYIAELAKKKIHA